MEWSPSRADNERETRDDGGGERGGVSCRTALIGSITTNTTFNEVNDDS